MTRIFVRGAIVMALLVIALGLPPDPATATSGNSITSPDTDGDAGSFSSLVLDTGGRPVVSYRDDASGDLNVLHCGDPSCTSGNTIAHPDAPGQAYGTSIALDAAGNPVVSYTYFDGAIRLKVLHCGNPACSSGNNIAIVDSALGATSFTSIELDASGNPVVVYGLGGYGGLNVAHCGNANCTAGNSITSPDTDGSVGTESSMALDTSGNPVVSYFGFANQDLKVLHCGNANCTAGNTIISPDTDGNVGTESSLALDTSGNPVVSYFDGTNEDLKVLHCGNANCTAGNTITSPDTDGLVGPYTSIALATDGFPVVSYVQFTPSTALKVLRCGDVNCASGNTIVAPDGPGRYTSLRLDALGNPVVSYQDGLNRDLKVLRCGDAACTGQKPPQPVVVLVHGYNGNSGNSSCGLSPLDEFIANSNNMDGHAFNVDCLNYSTRDGVVAGAVALALKIKSLTDSAGVDKVDLVAHSEGGLVSRYCVQFFSSCRARVQSLTMIGTPNLGTKIAIPPCNWALLPLTPDDQGACDMVPGSDLLTRLNQSPGPPGGIQYHVLMGNLQAIAADLYFGESADCVVPVRSANALGFEDPLYTVSHVGFDGIDAWCFNPGEIAYAPIQQRVADFLLQANGFLAAVPAAATAAGVPTVGPSGMLAATSGLIDPLQSIDLPVAIPAGMTTAGFFFQVPDGAAELTFTLLRPDGTPVGTADVDVTYDSGLVFGGLETHYIIADPAAGTWTMRIYGAAVPNEGWPYDLQALVPSGITVTASTDAGHYDTGATINLAAQVLINDVPLLSATVNGLVTKPDGTTSAVALVSDGSGQYLGSFSDTAACGLYQVAVTANGVDGTTPFTRIERTLAVVGVPGNVILDPCNADSDGDALTDEDETELYSTNPANPDTDGDSCWDGVELGDDETLGGLRDPLNPWDFYDVLGPGAALPTDGIIDLPNDILGVIQHFSPQGQAPYDVRFDRGPQIGANVWNMGPPDGVIDLPNDILGVILQFGHSCA